MNCEEAEELVGAYAVDALPEAEATRFRAHLETCADHAKQAAELRAISSTLAISVEPVPPPDALRARVLDAIAREPQDRARGSVMPRDITTARSAATAPRRPGPLQAWGALAAAIIAGLLVWNIVLQTDGGSGDGRLAAANADSVSTLVTADGASPVGTLLYFEDERKAIVIADGVGQLASSQTYQMWVIEEGGDMVSLGTMLPDSDGHATSEVALDASRAEAFAITIEPAGGSDQPTSDPVFTADVRS